MCWHMVQSCPRQIDVRCMTAVRCCVPCPSPHLLLITSFTRRFNLVQRRGQQLMVGSLGQADCTALDCLAATWVRVVLLRMPQCSGGSTCKALPRQLAVSASRPGEVREWQMENKTSKVHFTVLAAVLSKHENRSDGVSDCFPSAAWRWKLQNCSEPFQEVLPALSWLLWQRVLEAGTSRCVKQEKL